MGSDPDKVRLKQRLKDAIANSKAITNLADNPLLLTMMAILNRRQELPRDRADLYDQASRVLLYHWDVDHKRLQIPVDAIGRREKQEMLRLIAYEMQAGEEGLKGNLISAERLTRILTDYLRDQGFSESREKANRLIQQLRERNFILCYRGADTYGFMHRTFLEYFCAVEIVHRFEKQRTLTFEQLRDEVFGQHWQDETWHEVLKLICGAIDSPFVGMLIEFFLQHDMWDFDGLSNLLFCTDCIWEVENRRAIAKTDEKLLNTLKQEIENIFYYSPLERMNAMVLSAIPDEILSKIIKLWKYDPDTVSYLKNTVQYCPDINLSWQALSELVDRRKSDLDILNWLKEFIQSPNENGLVRSSALKALAKEHQDDPEIVQIIRKLAQIDQDWYVKATALDSLASLSNYTSDTLVLLKEASIADPQSEVRHKALEMIAGYWGEDINLFDWFCSRVLDDPFEREEKFKGNPRQTSLSFLVGKHVGNPKTLELLRDRAINDPDEQLREWAQEQLQQMESQGGSSEWT